MKRLFVVLLVCGLVLEVCSTYSAVLDSAAGQSPRVATRGLLGGGKASPIQLQRCRVQLIDHVTLAADQAGILTKCTPGDSPCSWVNNDQGDWIKEGDWVQAKDIVARLKDDVARAILKKAEREATNDVEERYAKANAEVAAAEILKARDANRRVRNAVPDIEVQRLELAAKRSVLQIEQASHRMTISKLEAEQARATLETYRVLAPFDGIVTKVYKSPGEAVRQGDPILELVSTKRVRVEGYVDVKDAYSVKPGAFVKVKLDVPKVDLNQEQETFEGRIAFVDVTVQPVTQQVRVWAEVENRENILRAGLTARMTIDPNRLVSAKTAAKNN